MRLQHLKSIKPAGKLKENGRFPRITSICWSSNNYKFAISNSDRNIIIYDVDGNERDKFATKSGNKQDTIKKYQITSIQFSPDSTKLAIAQTDNIVYIYRLGEDGTKFGEKKSICNKFAVSAAVTSMCWPHKRNDELVFGLTNGKLKIGILKINGIRKNKSATLFETSSFVHNIISSEDGDYFYSIHTNKCIYKYTFPDMDNNISAKKILLTQLSFIPNTIQIGNKSDDVLVTSIDGNVHILNSSNGEIKQLLEYSNPLINCSAMNPSGHNVVFGGFDCFFVLSYNRKNKEWQKQYKYNIDNIGSITSMAWKCDGSKLSISSMIGSVDFYEACLKRYKYGDRFSIIYTALNSVVVHNRFSDDKISIKSHLGSEIRNIEIMQNRFVIGKTEKSLILSDITNQKLLTEIPWNNNNTNNELKKEEFSFDSNIAMIFYSSELFIVELGCNEIIGSLRTAFNSPHLLSLRLYDNKKIIGYLLDLQSICIMDLDANMEVVTINHDIRIEWIELNEFGNQLLFMDKKRSLHLYDLYADKKRKKTLLNFCNYAQWVPDSNVIVAQNRNNLCVWYNIHNTAQVTIVDIGAGDVEDIERSDDKTLVLVNSNGNIIQYTLNESLITFATCLLDDNNDNKQYETAVTKLQRLCEKLDISSNCNSEIQSMWKQISQISLKNNDYKIAQRCFIALADISKAQYLNDIIFSQDSNEINAKLAILSKHFKKAESIYISNGEIDAMIAIYIKLNKFEDAIKLCKLRKHPLLNAIKEKYFQYLIKNEQHKKAAKLREIDGDYLGSVHLYLDNGFAVNALSLIMKYKIPIDSNTEMIDKIFKILTKQNDYKSAGLLFEYLGDYQRAFDIYVSGHCYFDCIDLAKKYNDKFGHRVTEIEAKWAHYLYDAGEYNHALPHFIECGKYVLSIKCAIKCKQFSKAIEILKGLNNSDTDPKYKSFYMEIGKHYQQIKKYQIAEKLYIKSGFIKKAILMQLNAGNFSRSNELAAKYLPDLNINDLYFEEAQRLQRDGNIEEAANILVKTNRIENAIQLFKFNYTKLTQIIRKHKPSKLNCAYLLIANQLKNENDFKNAETYFIKANDWKGAVSMFNENSMVEDALRVCKKYGDIQSFQNMVFQHALTINDASKAMQMLLNYNLSDKCIDYLLNNAMFIKAFDIAQQYNCKQEKINEIHYRFALHLEENGEFDKAEQQFIEGDKAKEAIEMFIHEKKWEDAIRVSQIHQPNVIEQVYKAHGVVSQEDNNLNEAEKWYIEGNAVQNAITMYEERAMYNDAIRLAQEYIPSLVHQLRIKQMNNNNDDGANSDNILQSVISKANFYKENGNYDEAVDVLLTLKYPNHSQDLNEIVSVWEEAVNISMEKALTNLPNTIRFIAKQLYDVGEFCKSAQYYLEINDHKLAINSFLSGNMFEKAREICKIYDVNNNNILDEIDKKYEEYLLSNDDNLDKLESINPSLATKIYTEKNKWNLAYKVAALHGGTSAVMDSAYKHSQYLFKNGQYIEAINILNEKGLQKSPETLSFYSELMNMVLLQINNSETIFITKCQAIDIFSKCKNILHSIVNWLNKIQNENKNAFKELLDLFHLLFIKHKCFETELLILYNKQCLSLLSYCDWIRCDVLFNDVGHSYKTLEKYQNAFIYYNHFIDICDNIDDPNDDIDYSDLNHLNNVSIPHKNIPNKHIYNEKHREEVRDWVLEMLATQEINPTLSDANASQSQPISKCIITGMPLFEGQPNIVECRSCHQTSEKSSWNLYVDHFKTCPWCMQNQAPIY